MLWLHREDNCPEEWLKSTVDYVWMRNKHSLDEVTDIWGLLPQHSLAYTDILPQSLLSEII